MSTAATPVESLDGDPQDEHRERNNTWLKIGLVGFALCGAVVTIALTTDATDAFAYTKPLAEIVQSPEDFVGQPLRVDGDLRQGSIQFREDPCEWRFVLQRDGEEMPVQFPQCVVPDTFRDDFGISVTVQGTLEADGTFLASELVPRCPSKYEMQERLEAGETMPHDDPTDEEEEEPSNPSAFEQPDPFALPE